MLIYHASQHIACYEDARRTLGQIGHTVAGPCQSGHSWVMGLEQVPQWSELNWSDMKGSTGRFYKAHKDEYAKYGAFLCTYPPAYAMLYALWQKPIIIHAPIRFDYPWSDSKEHLSIWIEWIRYWSKKGLLILTANNRYDSWWITKNTGCQCETISCICEYPGIRYDGSTPKEYFLAYKKNAQIKLPDNCVDRAGMGKHQYSDLLRFAGIVHIPYQVSTMSIFEQYFAGIPMFVPSIGYLRELYKQGQAMSEAHWSRRQMIDWQQVAKCADYYTELAHVQRFDNISHLNRLLKTVDLRKINHDQNNNNAVRKERILTQWDSLLKKPS
ncbi:MAG: hypothetical protein KKD77_22210 [Gammaproteobacteria bacterium]|nr:hypothetical protein [Gammaproteobacteria bacterium]